MENIAEQLYELLEYIQINEGFIRGSAMSHEKINGVLHFFVQYNLFGLKPAVPEEMMGELKQIPKSKLT